MTSSGGKPCVHCGECCMETVCPIGEIFLRTTEPPCPALAEDAEGKYWCGLVVSPEKTMFAQTDYAQWWARKLAEHLKDNVFRFSRGGCDRPF